MKLADFKYNTESKPLVSICVITYNHEKYIEEALESFLMQEVDFKVEIIIHDDASTDKTPEIIKRYHKEYPGLFKPLLQTVNQRSKFGGGMQPRFNYPRANGKYIALCDGDDYWTDPLKLQKQVDFLDANPEFAICGSLATRIYDDGVTQTDTEGEAGVFNQQDLAHRNFIPTVSVLFKKEYILSYPDWTLKCPVGDWPLFLICSNYGKIKIFNQEMVVRRIHSKGVWGANLNNSGAINNVKRLVQLFAILKDKFNSDINNILVENYLKQLTKLTQLQIKLNKFNQVTSNMMILFKEDLTPAMELELLMDSIVNKMRDQEKEIKTLKSLNTDLMASTSYRFGRQMTSIFRFLKRSE